mmetsp:Transcript_18511/g.60629  ORF Transcript_18511/g.60629 Transcript_18511/m.60629 type:complete len:240 (-) Transcript_18511:244-963(-)|eukprot:scaffold32375_cov107-Isochrysis_galbana.AAC.3
MAISSSSSTLRCLEPSTGSVSGVRGACAPASGGLGENTAGADIAKGCSRCADTTGGAQDEECGAGTGKGRTNRPSACEKSMSEGCAGGWYCGGAAGSDRVARCGTDGPLGRLSAGALQGAYLPVELRTEAAHPPGAPAEAATSGPGEARVSAAAAHEPAAPPQADALSARSGPADGCEAAAVAAARTSGEPPTIEAPTEEPAESAPATVGGKPRLGGHARLAGEAVRARAAEGLWRGDG